MRKRSVLRLLLPLLCALLLLPPLPVRGWDGEEGAEEFDEDFLSKSWEELVDELLEELHLPGTLALGYCNTVTGEEHYYNPDQCIVAASLYKTPLNMYFAEQIYLGNMDCSQTFDGRPYEEAQRASLTYSDNPTSEAMLAAIGGWRSYRIQCAEYLGEDPEDEDYLSRLNRFSAREMTCCMTLLQQQSERFPGVLACLMDSAPGKFLEYADVPFDIAQKYGNLTYDGNHLLHVSGIVYTDEPIALVVLTNNVGNNRGIMERYCLLMCDYAQAHVTPPAPEESAAEDESQDGGEVEPRPVIVLPEAALPAQTRTVAAVTPGAVIYYSALLLALAVLAGTALFFALCNARGIPLGRAALFWLLSLLLSLPLSRLVHWYCNSAQYPSLRAAMTDYRSGSYAALGAALAVVLSALLLRGCRVIRKLPALLDCLAPAAALTIGVGRLSCLFSSDDRSKFTLDNPALRRLPFMTSATLSSGVTEWRIATFAWQSMGCALICLLLLILFRRLRTRPRHREAWQDGNVFFLFLALYAAINIMLDSTRYDALYLRSNGFISLTQICCLAALLFVTVLYSVRSVITCGLRKWHLALWLLYLAGAGLAGYMEYYVQRHASRFLFSYAVMESCLLLLFALVCLLCRSTRATAAAAADSEDP